LSLADHKEILKSNCERKL